MSFPTAGVAVEGTPFREAQSCLGPKFAATTYKFFLSGTSTAANVYQDGALTTPFPITGNVASDNYGRFPAIYLNPAVTYRVQFFNSVNVQVWQQDPYVSQLSTVGTSSLSTYGLQIATTGELSIPAPNTGGSGVSLTLNCGGLGSAALKLVGTLAGNSALIVNNSATTGSQTATFASSTKPGTATSAPAAWLPITCDGVQYYTPIWHGNPFSPYVSSPSAQGEVINASTVTFTGSGLTTATGGAATPANWFAPTSTGIGTSYYLNITKTSGGSGIQFSAANGTWTNIGSGGLTISTNAQAPISGTYQLSTSVSGSPVVASGSITLANNPGVQSPTYNGATPLVLGGNGTATLGTSSAPVWYSPNGSAIGAGYYINITQTGGTSGYTFTSTSGGMYTNNIGAGGLTIGVTGTGAATFSVTGVYIISSDSAGTVQLGSGTITLTGSNVQSPNYSGLRPLVFLGNGSAQVNGSPSSDWYTPNTSNVGSAFWVNITRTSGTAGVNFSAAQGAWTNITNGGLTIDMSGYSGDVGTVSVGGTYQISSSSSGTPVLGSGSVTLSVNAGSVTRTYTSGTAATETVPTGATNLEIIADGGGGSGASTTSSGAGGSGGGSGEAHSVGIAVSGGQTLTYTVGQGGSGCATTNSNGNPGTASTVTGTGGLSGVSLTANGGGAGISATAVGGAGGTASGGNSANLSGSAGSNNGSTGGNAASGASGTFYNAPGNAPGAGSGGAHNTITLAGGAGQIVFKYT